ncbi:DUF397 domain-containing protein [Streptomyces aidingensis]|uniref:DUF397 domain-containing protein n=1 Tax=Streptomyces aidingensis TaxID=910347 RepID=A0A1I1FEH7_9ACTN|nr:DUF397 domain-containing protein [Streptomyces aidingensis]SFB97372.1 protein of unknown function [Streptomyces aidingensis]
MGSTDWQTSSYCQEGNSCVQAGTTGRVIRLRESAVPETVLTTTPGRLSALLTAIKTNRLP